ncbi:EboA domain-containing protein [Streptomyces sp. NPDC085540]|uniref:EboA domain-containing protein n=1 Tax=Streptomyces sp. NPDC085540 TaxID=3365730 RepID=UPI0037D17D42
MTGAQVPRTGMPPVAHHTRPAAHDPRLPTPEEAPAAVAPAPAAVAPGAPAALLATLEAALADALDDSAAQWLDTARCSVAGAPAALAALYPAAGRQCGRGPIAPPRSGAPHHRHPQWTVADAVRALLLAALPMAGEELAAQATACYRHGDAEERIAVLRALPLLDVGALGVPLVEDALRTNDTRLVAAAVGPYAASHLGQDAWRHAVLKCLFTGIPLTAVARIDERIDAELVRMLRDFADERRAAGRPVPPEIASLTEPFAPARRVRTAARSEAE